MPIPLSNKGEDMEINNIIEIFDNDEFISIVTKTGVAIHISDATDINLRFIGEGKESMIIAEIDFCEKL